ncbi:MAG: hypothetical protein M1402_03045 [Candidatus Thermoplasmatota archaeon]|nr:hypothetical protein [Candidatus Thermoplasmatota archaeon]
MIIDDERNVACGGDPVTFLKGVMKGLYFQLEPGQDAKILLLKEKYPFDIEVFRGIASSARVNLLEFKEESGEIELLIRRTN